MTGSLKLKKTYDAMYDTAMPRISKGDILVDPYIDDAKDQRKGLSLVFRPDPHICNRISEFLSELQKVEPTLYCQPLTDLHVTVMSLISCRDKFSYQALNLNAYLERIEHSIADVLPFEVNFKGLSLSQEAVMISGFPVNNSLKNVRDNLRGNFSLDEIFHTLDARYKTVLSHMTAVRYRAQPKNIAAFSNLIEKYREFEFGVHNVQKIELIETDWYARKKNVVRLETFTL